mmetsp:Transcript_28794/g.72937  ORF Transcript_28794/g.72937 Transcript_28794/m.72937 type:complete len:227 (-) Transcript_28794:280-960(-)
MHDAHLAARRCAIGASACLPLRARHEGVVLLKLRLLAILGTEHDPSHDRDLDDAGQAVQGIGDHVDGVVDHVRVHCPENAGDAACAGHGVREGRRRHLPSPHIDCLHHWAQALQRAEGCRGASVGLQPLGISHWRVGNARRKHHGERHGHHYERLGLTALVCVQRDHGQVQKAHSCTEGVEMRNVDLTSVGAVAGPKVALPKEQVGGRQKAGELLGVELRVRGFQG